MNNRGYPWVKLSTSLPDNPKFSRTSEAAQLAYFRALIWAGRGDAGGLLAIDEDALTLDDLAYAWRCDRGALEAALTELHRAGFMLLDSAGRYSVARWDDEQGPAQDDKRERWREAQRKHRDKALGQVEQDADAEQEQSEIERKRKTESKSKRVIDESSMTDDDTTTYHPPKNRAGGGAGAPPQPLREQIAQAIREQDDGQRIPNYTIIDRAIAQWTAECQQAKEDGKIWSIGGNHDAILERYDGFMQCQTDQGAIPENPGIEEITDAIREITGLEIQDEHDRAAVDKFAGMGVDADIIRRGVALRPPGKPATTIAQLAKTVYTAALEQQR